MVQAKKKKKLINKGQNTHEVSLLVTHEEVKENRS